LRDRANLAAGTDIERALTFADEKQAWRLRNIFATRAGTAFDRPHVGNRAIPDAIVKTVKQSDTFDPAFHMRMETHIHFPEIPT